LAIPKTVGIRKPSFGDMPDRLRHFRRNPTAEESTEGDEKQECLKKNMTWTRIRKCTFKPRCGK